MVLDEYIEYRCTVPRTLHSGVSPFHVVYGACMSSLVSRALESQYGDGEHIETFSRQSATCKSFANHLSVSYALSHCFVAVAPVVHLGAIVTERTHDTASPTRGGCRSRISRFLDPLKVPCRSWLSKDCRSRQPSSPSVPTGKFS